MSTTQDSDREDDYSIASGLNTSLLCNEDTFVDAYVVSSESDINNEIGNEAEASCLLTCCSISANNCNLNHVDVEGLRDKVAAPCLNRCCENSIIISNKINHVSVDASVNEVTNKSQLAQASFMDNHIVYDVNTLSVAEVEPGVAVDEVPRIVEECRQSRLDCRAGLHRLPRDMSIVPVLLNHRLQRRPKRLHSLQRGVLFVLNHWWTLVVS